MVPDEPVMGDELVARNMKNTSSPYSVEPRISTLVSGGSVVTVGNFDGVHLGHRTIIECVRKDADRRGLPSVAITFEPHPVEVFAHRPAATFRLATSAERTQQLGELGIQAVMTIPFTRTFAELSPAQFIENLLRRDLQAESVHVGWDFNFGKDRSGDTNTLKQAGELLGMEVTIHDAVLHEGRPISSTRIRATLRDGAIEEANRLLGTPWTVHSECQRGEGRGKALGIPTINLYPTDRLLPPDGVYTTIVYLDGGTRQLPAVSNLGMRPTFSKGSERRSLESFCLRGDPGDLVPGTSIAVAFLARIREERRFDSAEALVAQIQQDRVTAEDHHRARNTMD